MRTARFLKPDPEGGENPGIAIYHLVSRIVDRNFVLGTEEKEHFRMLMRMYSRFSGCRVLAYCFMSNHIHLLLEVPPGGVGKGESLGLSDEELLWRLGGLHSTGYVAGISGELAAARDLMAGRSVEVEGAAGLAEYDEEGRRRTLESARQQGEGMLAAVHERYSYRMHSLSEFMKGFLQRFTSWFNGMKGRKGTLWEERFKSVIVEDGLACRTMAAYIDLNPVRAGICEDPADYRWSSYGEAVGGGKGEAKARAGLVRALHGHSGRAGTARGWAQGGVAKEYRRILISGAVEQAEKRGNVEREVRVVTRKGMSKGKGEAELERLRADEARDLKISKVVRCRVRYFTEGAVIGSKAFVNEVFSASRERFGPKRKDGARKPRGALQDLAGEIWSLRDLQRG